MAYIETRKHGDGSVSYRVRWKQDGSKKAETFHTQNKADKFLASVEACGERYPDGWIPLKGWEHLGAGDDEHSFADVWAIYLDRKVGCTNEQWHRYQRMYELQFQSRWAHRPIASISPDSVQSMVNEMIELDRSPKTIRDYISILASCFEYARNCGYMLTNPAKLAMLPRKTPKRKDYYLTPQQFVEFRNNCHEDIRELITVAAGSGLRWAEITAAGSDSVVTTKEGTYLRVYLARKRHRATRTATTTTMVIGLPKGEKERLVLLAPSLVPIIERRALEARERVAQGKPDLLFPSPTGKPWPYNSSFLQLRWIPARDKTPSLPANFGFHGLRHTFAHWALSGDAPIQQVQDQMGHSTIGQTVDQYGGLLPGKRDRAVYAITDAFHEVAEVEAKIIPMHKEVG